MKIISLIHNVDNKNIPEEYFKKIREVLYEGKSNLGDIDLLIGPDYGLLFSENQNNENSKANFNLKPYIFSELSKISAKYPKTLILPGTIPIILRPGIMAHSCPAFLDGKNIREFFKETTCGDEKIAETNGLIYEGQDSNLNHIMHKNKMIAVEICSDHGRQIIPENTFLEVILAYDKNAGFSERPNLFTERYAIVCDGRKPATEAFSFNPYKKPTKETIKPVKKTENWKGYILE
ncbi:MAG TPA: hypothetical protein P5277_00310 [Candidatus Paceibacterota bacterium]|nr:hypothetical protein [Candidatus Paceibacterota bacterium]